MNKPQSTKLLGETLVVVGLVFAAFGAFTLWEGEPFTPARRTIGHLLAFLDPMTAMRVFSYSSIVFGILLAALGVFLLMKAKQPA